MAIDTYLASKFNKALAEGRVSHKLVGAIPGATETALWSQRQRLDYLYWLRRGTTGDLISWLNRTTGNEIQDPRTFPPGNED